MFTLHHGHELRSLKTTEEVDASLDQLERELTSEDASMVTIERADTTALSIGTGRKLSVLNSVARGGEPPYFTSGGGSDDAGEISFLFGGQWSEFRSRNAIPLALARKAMRLFCGTGELTTEVQWEEV